ncbi:protein INCA1 isoform X2 [Elgaria multicarinata webbii]
MVSRYKPEEETSSSDYPSSDFWDRLSRQPSFHWMEEYHEAPPLLTSGCVAQRPAGAEKGSFPWPTISTLQKLPSPKELCQRKKKGPKQKKVDGVRALSVLYHLEELKKRQSSIDELKKAKWGVSEPQPFYEGAAAPLTKAPCPEGSLSPSSVLGTDEFCEELSVFNGPCHTQLLYPEWNPTMREQLAIPQESPIISYMMATQDRNQGVAVGCWLEEEEEEDFWGCRMQSEE